MIELDFSKYGGLIPAIAQDFRTGEVLMLANINPESWQETLATGRAVYYSRSRKRLWRKGEESGNVQLIREILGRLRRRQRDLQGRTDRRRRLSHRPPQLLLRKVDGGTLVETGETVFDPKKVYNKQ